MSSALGKFGDTTGLGIFQGNAIGAFAASSQLLTVGVGGRFSTIQAAIDYVNSQPAFIPHPNAADLGAAVASAWVSGTSAITTSTNVSVYPQANSTWFSFTGDTFYYPWDTASNRLVSGTIYSAHRRIEAGNLAAGSAFNWWQENRFTILLLNPFYSESLTLNADANITFTSLSGQSVWSGILNATAAVKNGRIRFSRMRVANGRYDAEFAGVGLGGAAFSALSSIIIEHDRVTFDIVASDWYSYEFYAGSLHSNYSIYNQRPSNGSRGHFINLHTAGDQVFQNAVWNLTNSDNLAPAIPDAYFIDRFSARQVIIAGLNGNIRDKASTLQKLSLVGEGVGGMTGFEHLTITDTTLVLEGVPWWTTGTPNVGASFSLLTLGANNTAGEATIHNSSIIAPTRGAGAAPVNKLVRIAANPAGMVTVNKGFNPLAQTYDTATANVTYVTL